jgi:hypothetical protein
MRTSQGAETPSLSPTHVRRPAGPENPPPAAAPHRVGAAAAGATGRTATVRVLPDQPGDVPQTYADVSKAEKLLGYRPQTAIREGVAKYVEWYVRTVLPAQR